MRLNELKPLKDIIDTFDKILDDVDEYCNETEQLELVEEIMIELDYYLEENIDTYVSPKFKEKINEVLENIVEEVLSSNEGIDKEHYCYEQLYEILINKTKQIYFTIRPLRSHKTNAIIRNQTEKDKLNIKTQLDKIEIINNSLPEQRTEKWYEMRYNLLSASSIWKAIDSDCNVNSIIYEKCKPLNTEKYNSVNVNTPFHWGQKYEPVSQMYYEYKYNAIIKEYGCIPHEKHKFLGASPDGINVNPESSRYGRMLEIKNIVNREITGIPKKEYWVQTQLQMECCDLDECDFLECRFNEYDDEEEFKKDGSFQYTNNGNYKGIMIQFIKDEKPHYEYMPFNITENEYNKWCERIMEENNNLTWIRNIYWKLDEISCVLIERNREWFESVVSKFQEVWKTIERERISGYEHRQPQRRGAKTKQSTKINVSKINTGVCNIMLEGNNEENKNNENKERNSNVETTTKNIISKSRGNNKDNNKKMVITINTS